MESAVSKKYVAEKDWPIDHLLRASQGLDVKAGRLYRRGLSFARQAYTGGSHLFRTALKIAAWLIRSREHTNFTYELTTQSLTHLAHTLSAVSGLPVQRVRQAMEELSQDSALGDFVRSAVESSPEGVSADRDVRYSRHLSWYVLARLTKPRFVVETGVDKGLGSLVLCSALMRNTAEGHPGRYYGIDIRPAAGWLLRSPYSDFGSVLYGDSVEVLAGLEFQIDLFISDSDHADEYEFSEYAAIASKLSERAILVSDNAHESDALCRFAESSGRRFAYFGERAKDHWYAGGGTGFSW